MTTDGRRPKILLVDDDAELLGILETRINALDRFDVFSLTRAREVLTRLEGIRPDLIVSDIDMPGMDGGALAGALRDREAGRRIPILFLSSLIPLSENSGERRVGGWPMLSKSTPFEKLVAAIDRSLSADSDGPKPAGADGR